MKSQKNREKIEEQRKKRRKEKEKKNGARIEE